MAARIQFKRGLASAWTSANPVLYIGECGFETDTGKLKVGDGTTAWNSLSYFFGDISGASLSDFGDVSGATPNTGNFLKYDGSSWGPYNISLGTDTTGNYLVDLTAGTGITVTHTPGEGSNATIAIGQAVATNSNVTFNDVTAAGNVTITGNLTVNGTTTTINSTTISVDDKNIELASVSSPDDTTADGAGITVKGATDKTWNWVDATDAWSSSEHINIASGKSYYINGTSVLNGTTLGSGVTASSLTSVGTISTGVWQGTIVGATYGGTGVNNGSSTITLGGNLTTSGAFGLTLTQTGTTNVTLPTTGTLATLSGTETLNNKTLETPSLTGTPTAPTASADTNTTQVATTAFVITQASGTTPSYVSGGQHPTIGSSLKYARADHTHGYDGLGLTSGTLAQFSATTSSQLAGIISDETGSGSLVFGTSPTIATPVLTLSSTPSTTDAIISWDATNKKIQVGNGSISLDFASSNVVTNAQTASYTLVLGDKDKLVEISNASANTLTVPLNSSVAFPVGTQITILQTGAGQTTIAGTGGVTVNGTPGLKLRAQWSSVTLIKRATDTWVALGDLQA